MAYFSFDEDFQRLGSFGCGEQCRCGPCSQRHSGRASLDEWYVRDEDEPGYPAGPSPTRANNRPAFGEPPQGQPLVLQPTPPPRPPDLFGLSPEFQRELNVKRPYSELASAYDQTIGWPAFHCARRAFEALARRYGLRFRSAADIGCGTGLFARYLSGCWRAPVWAVDISPEMLRVAERNCSGANVRLLRQDIRCLRLPEPVDLVTSNFDALNHLTGKGELRVAFQCVAGNLRPGGHLYFDLVTPCQPIGDGTTYVRRMNTSHGQVIQQFRWDKARRTISAFVFMRSMDAPQPTAEVHRERAYSFAEVGMWLLDAGFAIRGVHDALTLKPASGCPARIIVVAQKISSNGKDLK